MSRDYSVDTLKYCVHWGLQPAILSGKEHQYVRPLLQSGVRDAVQHVKLIHIKVKMKAYMVIPEICCTCLGNNTACNARILCHCTSKLPLKHVAQPIFVEAILVESSRGAHHWLAGMILHPGTHDVPDDLEGRIRLRPQRVGVC